jgi:hypothetical protein
VLFEARNEIMARRGYAFTTGDAVELFRRKAYYSPRTRTVSLNATEKANVKLIQAFEPSAPRDAEIEKLEPMQVLATVRDMTGPDQFLAVRAGPGTQFTEQDRLNPLSPVSIYYVEGNWAHVEYAGGGGWVSRSFLDEGSTQQPRISSRRDSTNVLIIKEAQPEPVTPVLSASGPQEVRPNAGVLEATARRVSEKAIRVRFYIPGTSDVGLMWVEPEVSEEGKLIFQLHFLDPKSPAEKVAYSLPLADLEVQAVTDAFRKAQQWADTAKREKVRDFAKVVACLPEGHCTQPPQGASATEIVFRTSEDGAPSVVIRRRLGEFVRTYAFNIEEASRLVGVLQHTRSVGEAEFRAGSRTTEELNKLFH